MIESTFVKIIYAYSLSAVMKLPRLRVLLLRLPPKKPPLPVFAVYVSFLLLLPPRQNRTVARKRHTNAAHSNPRAYEPIRA